MKQKSDSASAKQREKALREAIERAEVELGNTCIICGQAPVEWHHAYTRGARPDLRANKCNLYPLCKWNCHPPAQDGAHWSYWALKEVTDERLAHERGDRLEVGRQEIQTILQRWQEKWERRHVSPIGKSD